MDPSTYYTEFPADSEFLDAEPLHLSGNTPNNAGLDDFEFLLEDDPANDQEVFFAEADTELQTELQLESSSMNSITMMRCDTIHEDQEARYSPARQQRRGQRDRAPSPSNIDMKDVNFDPPAYVNIPSSSNVKLQHSRQTSHSDLSMCSYATAPQHISSQGNVSSTSSITTSTSRKSQYTKSEYNLALTNLAASMKRTTESRRVVNTIKPHMFTPEQQVQLSDAKAQLHSQNQQVQSGFMQALEQSRKQLGQYLGSMNGQTL